MAKKYAMKINSRRRFLDRGGIIVNEISKKVPPYYIKPKKMYTKLYFLFI